jgi:hypothetical protein
MVGKAIAALKERGVSSRQAILKYIMANFMLQPVSWPLILPLSSQQLVSSQQSLLVSWPF